MSFLFPYLRYSIAFICFVLSCVFLILFILEFYELINRCYSINRFSISLFSCVQVFYYEMLKTSFLIVISFLLAIFIMQKITIPFKSGD